MEPLIWTYIGIFGALMFILILSRLDEIVLEDEEKFIDTLHYDKRDKQPHPIQKVVVHRRTRKIASIFRKQRTEVTWKLIVKKNRFDKGDLNITTKSS